MYIFCGYLLKILKGINPDILQGNCLCAFTVIVTFDSAEFNINLGK